VFWGLFGGLFDAICGPVTVMPFEGRSYIPDLVHIFVFWGLVGWLFDAI
jgi:hypothetical protein